MLKSLQAKRIWEHRESNRNCKTNKKGVYSHRFKFQRAQTILWDCSYDLPMLFSICLHLLLKYNLQIFCDFLDLKLLNSCSNQEFNMLSKIIQKALHVDQYGRASLRGHTCYLWAEASSALPLFPDILLRRAISFLLPCERPRNPLPATPLQRQSVPYGRYTTGQWSSSRSSNHPHGNNCKYFALTRNASSPVSMRGLQLSPLCSTAEKQVILKKKKGK